MVDLQVQDMYISHMKDYDGTMTNHAPGHETMTWRASDLRPGEVYRFHVVLLLTQWARVETVQCSQHWQQCILV